ncbi:MAG TPA: hypothetical protein VN577_03175 [Terriglobales bacterium]|nr:hypothetical protein [Terriglobales bacterium]
MPKPSPERSKPPVDLDQALKAAKVFDLDRARQTFGRIASRVHPAISDTVLSLLHELPDPDGALTLFDRLVENAGPEVLRLFEKRQSLTHYALTVFGFSQYLGETLLLNTDLLQGLPREEVLDRSHSPEEFKEAFARFRSRSFDTDLAQLLARFKRREYVRIMLRDVLGLAALAETTAEISSLSDVLIDEATRECEAAMKSRFGPPQHLDRNGKIVETPFTVLALGKLGGSELNYSSDVDLLFLYAEGEAPEDATISNREYFIRLSQAITDVLSRVTKEGVVFRIDLRLRPQGHEGEPAVSLSRALQYYFDIAHDWERQALIKVRHCAGDLALARQFIRKVQEYVYKPDINFSAIETALETRDRIHSRRNYGLGREKGIDVKLDRGGIRDIEFLVQCLQRVYGGKERWLRSGGTLFSLQKLHDKQHITGHDFHQLTTSYEFLRRVEHLLQLRRGQQTHRVPPDGDELQILQRSMESEDIVAQISDHMAAVSEIYERVVHHQQQTTEEQAQEEFALRTLDLSFGRVQSDHQVLQRLATDNEKLHAIASQQLAAHTRRNLFRFLSSSLTSAERFHAVANAADCVESALELFERSEFLTDLLVRHPEDVTILRRLQMASDNNQSKLFVGAPTAPQSSSAPDYLAGPGIPSADKIAFVRRNYRQALLLSGAQDILQDRSVFDALRENTQAADAAIRSAVTIANARAKIAVVALGRLGTLEFDCLSDADLIFIRRDDIDPEDARKAAEDVVQVLSVYTSDGALMPVDLRLRPHGGEGELTFTSDQLASYFAQEAQPWEALTYTKFRFVAGDADAAMSSALAVPGLFRRFAASASFAEDVRSMRARLEASDDGQNLRTAPGGFYDVDFLISFLSIKHSVKLPEGNTLARLQQLERMGALPGSDAQRLSRAAEFYRTVEHVTRLVTGRNLKSLPPSDFARDSVIHLVMRRLKITDELDSLLALTRTEVRALFDRLVV